MRQTGGVGDSSVVSPCLHDNAEEKTPGGHVRLAHGETSVLGGIFHDCVFMMSLVPAPGRQQACRPEAVVHTGKLSKGGRHVQEAIVVVALPNEVTATLRPLDWVLCVRNGVRRP